MAILCLALLAAPFLARLHASASVRLVAALPLALGVLAVVGMLTAHAPMAVRVALAACIFGVGIHFRDGWARVLRSPACRDILSAWALVAVAVALLSLSATHYSGGAWGGDFQEHYERAEFFAGRRAEGPTASAMAARPPVVNAALGFGLALSGAGFAGWAVEAALLSSFVVVPLAALARHFSRGRRVGPWVALVVVASPMVMETCVYPWTKAAAAMGALAAICLATRSRWALAGIALGIGVAAHQSAVVYAVPIAACALWRCPRGAVRAGAACALALLPFAAWTVATSGLSGALLAPQAVAGPVAEGTSAALARIAGNLWATIVPHPLRMDAREFGGWFGQESSTGAARDWFFTLYQTNAVAAFGLSGVFAVLAAMREGRRAIGWAAVVALGVLAGGVLDPCVSPWGQAHLVGVAAVGVACAFAAARMATATRAERGAWLLALAVDFAAGVALQMWCQAGDPWTLSRQAAVNAAATESHGWALAGAGPWLVAVVALAWVAYAVRLATAGRSAPYGAVAEDRRIAEFGTLHVDR